MVYFAIAIGGAAGSVLRYIVQTTLRDSAGPNFPWGTLTVNLVGSLLIGICAALGERYGSWIRPWLMTGFLGGFTTFSAFSLENADMLRDGRILAAVLYVALSVGAGAALAFAGYFLARG